jgi:hypothetical protein
MVGRIRKRDWYRLGGFKNNALFCRQSKNGAWQYFVDLHYQR